MEAEGFKFLRRRPLWRPGVAARGGQGPKRGPQEGKKPRAGRRRGASEDPSGAQLGRAPEPQPDARGSGPATRARNPAAAPLRPLPLPSENV